MRQGHLYLGLAWNSLCATTPSLIHLFYVNECLALHECICITCMLDVQGGQERASDPWTGAMDACELTRGYWIPWNWSYEYLWTTSTFWGVNLGPLKELLTAVPSLQSYAVLADNSCSSFFTVLKKTSFFKKWFVL